MNRDKSGERLGKLFGLILLPAADDSIPPLMTVGHSGASPHHIQGDAQAMPTLSTLLLALARQLTNRDFRLQEALVYASVQR